MKTRAYVLLAAFLVWSLPALCLSASVEDGKKLFATTEMGSNGKSCATCHPEGEDIGNLSGMDPEELAAAVNSCLVKALGGKPLPEDSEEMHSLILYLQSLNPE